MTEIFGDSKEQLEQLTADLQETGQQLQETQKDLQETRDRLDEEAFITSKLQSTEEELYSTADKVSPTSGIVNVWVYCHRPCKWELGQNKSSGQMWWGTWLPQVVHGPDQIAVPITGHSSE